MVIKTGFLMHIFFEFFCFLNVFLREVIFKYIFKMIVFFMKNYKKCLDRHTLVYMESENV